MIVYRAPGTTDRPMIRIVNKTVAAIGFDVGTPIDVSYALGFITIRKAYQAPSDPLGEFEKN